MDYQDSPKSPTYEPKSPESVDPPEPTTNTDVVVPLVVAATSEPAPMSIPSIVTKDLEQATNALAPPLTDTTKAEPFRKLSSLMQNAKSLVGMYGAYLKRKAPTITVSLTNFVSIMRMMYRDSVYNGKTITIPDNYEAYYVREQLVEHAAPEAKHAKKSAVVVSDRLSDANDEAKKQHSESLYLEIFMQLAQDLESRGATFQFSREALKYFLATRKRFVSHNNFLDTNSSVKSDKSKSKLQHLSAGAILMEYLKGVDMFTSSLHRAQKDDVRALKEIIDSDMSIPVQIYTVVRHANYHQTRYLDARQVDLPTVGYAKIPIPNLTFKRAQIIVTRYLVLMMDNNQFVINSAIEKDLAQMLVDSYQTLKPTEYLVFDASVGVKSKLIDLVGMSIEGKTLPDSYMERLALVSDRYKNVKMLSPTTDTINSNYLFKPTTGFEPSYIQLKPLLTAAIIGVSDRFAYAALINDESDSEKELVVVNRFGISGSATCMIATAEFQPPTAASDSPSVLVNGESYRIIGDLESITLFVEAVLVEIKDAHKFAGISTRPVSSRSEYKQLYQATKDVKNNDQFVDMINDPSRISEIVELLKSSVHFDRLKAMMDSDMQFNPSF